MLLEVDFLVAKKQLKQILEKVINTHGASKTAEVLDSVKAIGYKYSTRAAMTVSISDMTVPPQKPEMINRLLRISLTRSQETINEVLLPKKNVIKKLSRHGRRLMIPLQKHCWTVLINITTSS